MVGLAFFFFQDRIPPKPPAPIQEQPVEQPYTKPPLMMCVLKRTALSPFGPFNPADLSEVAGIESLKRFYSDFQNHRQYTLIEIALIQKKLIQGIYDPHDALTIISTFNTSCIFYKISVAQRIQLLLFFLETDVYTSEGITYTKDLAILYSIPDKLRFSLLKLFANDVIQP